MKLLFLASRVFFALEALNILCSAADVLTTRYNNSRTAWDSDETALTPANVNANSFGLLSNFAVDAQVYAQPLYVTSAPVFSGGQFMGRHNLLIVGTENSTLYAFDADSGTLYWRTSMLGPNEVAYTNDCPVLPSSIGITSTPVIDRNVGPYGTIYVVAMSETTGSTQAIDRLHAIDLSTGSDVQAPVTIQASFPDPQNQGPNHQGNPPRDIFDPVHCHERAGLVLSNGLIYTAWASFCDFTPYSGWVIAYAENNLKQVAVLNTNPNGTPPPPSDLSDGSGAGIWQAGSGAAVDSNGYLYLSTGNGPFDLTVGDYGDSFLKLSPGLNISDYFTPFDQQNDANNDLDFASGGSMVLDLTDSNSKVHHLAVAAGKDTNIYIVNRDNMGQFHSGGNIIYQELPGAIPGGVWGSPAYFNGSIYYGGASGGGDVGLPGSPILQFQFTNQAMLNPTPSSITSNTFNYPGAALSVSSFGNSNGIVWANEYVGDIGGVATGPMVLHAYDATNLSTELYQSTQNFGAGTKFVIPTVCDGKVYVATQNSVATLGLLNPVAATDVSSTVQIARGGFRYIAKTGHLIQLLTLTNVGGTKLGLPLSLVLDNLSSSAALANASGATTITNPSASQYVNAPLSSSLPPGQSIPVTLEFIDTLKQPVSYTTRVLAGPNSR